MKKIQLIYYFLIVQVALFSQEVEFLYGIEMYYNKVDIGKNKLTKSHYNNTDPHWKVRTSFYPFAHKNIGIIGSYHTLRPLASVQIGTDEEISSREDGLAPYINGGSGKTTVHRIGLGMSMKHYIWRDRIKLNTRLILNNEKSIQTWEPGYAASNNPGRYTYQLYSYSSPGFQIVPELNLGLQINLYRWINFNIDYSYLQGFRPFMNTEVYYTIDGIEQPKARFYVDGTGHHIMFGLSISFIKK